ncbi:hypothetical protein [Streptomyces ficellus]|uniref:Uncharacterized protein n=1 Tax=Streptomyces ficellus TaxID=1977088 RepID=A0A6I6FDI4_9ACTN|nr:hypothetical protein [Streptomyces ficellus]QGV81750.1 hypothetical protein EIZ62_28475 [Streptomyces ficellus]
MADSPEGGAARRPGAWRRAWSEHPAVIIAALITAIGALAAAVVQGVNWMERKQDDDSRAQPSVHSSPPAPTPPPQQTSSTPSPPPARAPSDADRAGPAPRWRGPVTLPLSLNVPSDVGAELDGKGPGRLAGVDDDLRGDYSTTPAVLVMSGRAAETGRDLDALDAPTCEASLPPLPGAPPAISAYREGTYCFATSSGGVGAFSITSPPALSDIPDALTVQVVLWE